MIGSLGHYPPVYVIEPVERPQFATEKAGKLGDDPLIWGIGAYFQVMWRVESQKISLCPACFLGKHVEKRTLEAVLPRCVWEDDSKI